MGEDPKYVFNVGCPRIDLVKHSLKKKIKNINRIFFKNGVGDKFDLKKDFITVMQYPVTTEYGENHKNMKELLKAVSRIDCPKLIFWPNADAGSDEIASAIREYREKKLITNSWFVKNLNHQLFFYVLNNTKCLVGNTSSAIREGSYIGVPSISVGTRQNGRERSKNIINSKPNSDEIYKKIIKQMKMNKKLFKSKMYGDGFASKRIVKILENVDVKIQKKLLFR